MAVAGASLTGLAVLVPAQADPLWPGGPDVPGVPALVPPGSAGVPGLPQLTVPLAPTEQPSVFPANGEVVGGKRAVDVFFREPITDRAAAESTVSVTPSMSVAGHFNWVDDSHLQWVPDDFWPRNTAVTVQATGSGTAFKISDAFEAVADAGSHVFSVKIGGDVVREMPTALGKPGHESPNGTFKVLAKEADVVMDSSTYGVPIDAPEGYRVDVKWATRLTWDGIYVHAAPWSVDDQGNANVSHGCINLSTANAKWYFDNVRNGDAVTIVNA